MNLRLEKRIKVLCSKEAAEALELYLKWVKCYEHFKESTEVFSSIDELKRLLWDNYYFLAVFIAPYTIETLHKLVEERDFVIFSQRLARHHIYFFNWFDVEKPVEKLIRLLERR